jgi:hypothetical protein
VSKFLIQSTPKLTAGGRVGAVLFVLGPLVVAVLYVLAYSFGPYAVSGVFILIGAVGIVTVLAFVLLLTGRGYEHEVTVIPGDDDGR